MPPTEVTEGQKEDTAWSFILKAEPLGLICGREGKKTMGEVTGLPEEQWLYYVNE